MKTNHLFIEKSQERSFSEAKTNHLFIEKSQERSFSEAKTNYVNIKETNHIIASELSFNSIKKYFILLGIVLLNNTAFAVKQTSSELKAPNYYASCFIIEDKVDLRMDSNVPTKFKLSLVTENGKVMDGPVEVWSPNNIGKVPHKAMLCRPFIFGEPMFAVIEAATTGIDQWKSITRIKISREKDIIHRATNDFFYLTFSRACFNPACIGKDSTLKHKLVSGDRPYVVFVNYTSKKAFSPRIHEYPNPDKTGYRRNYFYDQIYRTYYSCENGPCVGQIESNQAAYVFQPLSTEYQGARTDIWLVFDDPNAGKPGATSPYISGTGNLTRDLVNNRTIIYSIHNNPRAKEDGCSIFHGTPCYVTKRMIYPFSADLDKEIKPTSCEIGNGMGGVRGCSDTEKNKPKFIEGGGD